MIQLSGAGTTKRTGALAAVVIFSVGLTAPTSTPAQAVAAPAAAGLDIASVGPGPLRWHSSHNAKLREVTSGSETVGQLQPRRLAGRKTIKMRSASSSSAVAEAGSTVQVTASVGTTQSGGRIGVRAYEVVGNRVVGQRTVYVKPGLHERSDASVSLTTTRAGSRIQVLVFSGVTRRHVVLAGSVEASMTPPPPPGGGVGGGAPGAASCEDIDYADPAQGRLTFSDEFDGSSVDRTTWRVRDRTHLDFDQAQIRAENVTVHDGALDIAGRKLPSAQWQVTPSSRYDWNKTRDYSTGYIDTIDAADSSNAAADRFSQRYGYFEIRALVPSAGTMSRGIWPAFWLRGDKSSGELDVMEAYGAPTTRSIDPSRTYQWNSWGNTSGVNTEQMNGTAHPKYDNDPIWKDWHTYGVNWSPTCLRYTYDGRTVGVVPTSARSYLSGAPFDDKFHIRLNMQIGSNYWGKADDGHTRPDFHYLVDYVRVYQGLGD